MLIRKVGGIHRCSILLIDQETVMLGMRLCLTCCHQARLDQSQKLAYKLLLNFKLEDGGIPSPTVGFEGMLTAHRILRDRDAVGVLIGGLAETVWNRNRKKEELEKHKDVDVLVLPREWHPTFELSEDFEGGIDWWLPKERRIQIRHDTRIVEKKQLWYQNGNGVKLRFGMSLAATNRLKNGLHILHPRLVATMRFYEAIASVNLDVDDDVEKAFEKKVTGRMGVQLPTFIRRSDLCGVVLDSVGLIEFDHETVSALDKVTD